MRTVCTPPLHNSGDHGLCRSKRRHPKCRRRRGAPPRPKRCRPVRRLPKIPVVAAIASAIVGSRSGPMEWCGTSPTVTVLTPNMDVIIVAHTVSAPRDDGRRQTSSPRLYPAPTALTAPVPFFVHNLPCSFFLFRHCCLKRGCVAPPFCSATPPPIANLFRLTDLLSRYPPIVLAFHLSTYLRVGMY
jgi:hypothetical protein